MARSRVVRFDALRSLAFGSIGANYAAIGTQINQLARLVAIKNNTDAVLLLSFDGTTDNDVLMATTGQVLDFTANKTMDDGAGSYFIEKGTTIYVKHAGVAPTSGSIYVTVVYGKGD